MMWDAQIARAFISQAKLQKSRFKVKIFDFFLKIILLHYIIGNVEQVEVFTTSIHILSR
jgi:hypothetical protein